MVDSETEQVCTFETFDEAKAAVGENILGRAYGGRVYNTDEDGEEV